MTSKELLKADMLDILFEHRNKLYGAYALRKDYNQRLGKALAIALSVVIFFILFSAFRKDNDSGNSPINVSGPIALQPLDLKAPEEKKPEQKVEQDVKKVKSSEIIRIVPDNETPDMPEQKDIKDAVVSGENKNGKTLEDPNMIVKDSMDNRGDGKKTPDPEPESKPLPTYAPSFPGGQTAWLNYLRKFLQTPDALEAGQRIEVRVKFWVETDGYVSRFEIIQSGGSDFDREVLRVMKRMPKWEPAMQNGQKIAVSFTQPVIFVGVEE